MSKNHLNLINKEAAR